MKTIEDARSLCLLAHSGQTRKDGITPYSTHPIAVSLMMTTTDEIIVALLHDVLEDTTVTDSKLIEMGYDLHIVKAIKALTRKQGECYEDYLQIISEDPLACKVKIADMLHNMSDSPSEKQKEKYRTGIKTLLKII